MVIRNLVSAEGSAHYNLNYELPLLSRVDQNYKPWRHAFGKVT